MTSLADLLARGPIPASRAIDLSIGLANEVAARGRPHLQLEPRKVEVSPEGLFHRLAEPDGATQPAYLAPEQWDAGSPGAPADVYALGALLHHMLTGSPPREARQGGPLPPPPGTPAPLAELLQRTLATRPEERLPDAAAFRMRLLGLPPPRPALARPAALLGAGLLGLGLLLIVLLAGGPGSGGLLGWMRTPGDGEQAYDTGRRPWIVPAAAGETGRAPEPAGAQDTGRAPDLGSSDTGRAPEPGVSTDTGRAPEPGVSTDTGRADEPAVATETGRADEPTVAGDTGRADEPTVAGDTGRADQPAVAGETGRADEPTVAGETGRADEPTVAGDTGRADQPAVAGETGRATDLAGSNDTGRAPGPASETDPGRDDWLPPEETGRAAEPASAPDTGRSPEALPYPTGRRASLPEGAIVRARPDGSETVLLRVPAGPVLTPEGARIHVPAFYVEQDPPSLADYASYLAEARNAGEPLDPLLPAGEAAGLLRAHLESRAPLPQGDLPPLTAAAGAAWLEWCGLRPLDARQRLRAAQLVGLPADDLRGGWLPPAGR